MKRRRVLMLVILVIVAGAAIAVGFDPDRRVQGWSHGRAKRPGQVWPSARQVPKSEASASLASLPSVERVPPLILRLVTRWRSERSASLLVEGTAGSATKTNSSGRYAAMRRHSVACGAAAAARDGGHSASRSSGGAIARPCDCSSKQSGGPASVQDAGK